MRKNFGSKLDSSKSNYKEHKSAKVQAYLTRRFMHAIKSSKGDPDSLKADLLNVPDHAFSKHINCGPWCKAKALDDPPTYKYSQLPRGTPLQSEDLHTYLSSLIAAYAASATKLVPGSSSTRANLSIRPLTNKLRRGFILVT